MPNPLSKTLVFRRRSLLLAASGTAALGLLPRARAAGATLPAPESLADELDKALRKGQPLIVMVSLDGCPFCRIARDSYLEPLRREEGLPIFQVDMRSQTTLRDFNKLASTHDQMVRGWKIRVAPTVLFFGTGGKEVAPRMNGAYIEDFYGAYLQQRIDVARAAIKN